MPEGLVLDNVRIYAGDTLLLEVSLCIAPGEIATLMGPSGSGKSTLLDHVMGDLPRAFRATGTMRLGDETLDGKPPEARRIGVLYQDPLLFPHLSVAQNLAFGLPRGTDRAAKINAALADIGLPDFGPRDPATLSGGQAARVALMRTLLAEPRALLLDEPFSKLDTARRDQMRRLVFDRARAAGVPILMVTHDEADAAAAGGTVIRLDAADQA